MIAAIAENPMSFKVCVLDNVEFLELIFFEKWESGSNSLKGV